MSPGAPIAGVPAVVHSSPDLRSLSPFPLSQSSQSLWNRLSVLLNLLPAVGELRESGEWVLGTALPSPLAGSTGPLPLLVTHSVG